MVLIKLMSLYDSSCLFMTVDVFLRQLMSLHDCDSWCLCM